MAEASSIQASEVEAKGQMQDHPRMAQQQQKTYTGQQLHGGKSLARAQQTKSLLFAFIYLFTEA